RYKVRAIRNQDTANKIDHVESTIMVYVVKVDASTAYDTAGWQKKKGEQNPFPEAAVNEIAVSDILAVVKINRKHFWSGMLEFYDFKVEEITLLPSEEILKKTYGENFPEELKKKLDSLEGEAKPKWGKALSQYEKAKIPQTFPTRATASKIRCNKCNKEY